MTRQGWYAVLCLHVTWLLWAGVIKGLGVMLPTLMEQFTAQTWLIGWMIAIAVGVADVTGRSPYTTNNSQLFHSGYLTSKFC